MYRILTIFLIGFFPILLNGQTQNKDSKFLKSDISTILSDNTSNRNTKIHSSETLLFSINTSTLLPDTLKSFLVKKDPPFLHNLNMNHKEKPILNKIVRGSFYTLIYNTTIMTGLVLSPTWLNQWDNLSTKLRIKSMKDQYKNSYTKPPVIDHDMFITNYLGHPYQGGFYYNSIRSQGATVIQSSLFCLGHTLLWEYGWEAGIEQPSIQDLIVTPLAGILVGELSHVATVKMSKNGFTMWEKVAVCIINPSYVINNNFSFKSKKLN